jgi:hypothetical protein
MLLNLVVMSCLVWPSEMDGPDFLVSSGKFIHQKGPEPVCYFTWRIPVCQVKSEFNAI